MNFRAATVRRRIGAGAEAWAVSRALTWLGAALASVAAAIVGRVTYQWVA